MCFEISQSFKLKTNVMKLAPIYSWEHPCLYSYTTTDDTRWDFMITISLQKQAPHLPGRQQRIKMHIFNKMLFFHFTCTHITSYVSRTMVDSICLESKVNMQQQISYKLKVGFLCNGLYFGIYGRTQKCLPTTRQAVKPTLHQGDSWAG